MNTYRVEFFAQCPVTPVRIHYFLSISTVTEDVIEAEKLTAFVQRIERGLHEEIAELLFLEFGGVQTLKAFHHGVEIETTRSAK